MKIMLKNLIADALNSLKAAGEIPQDVFVDYQIERSRDEKHGDFACNVALPLAKRLNMAPRDLALKIINNLAPTDCVTKVEIAGPGFINFFVSELAFQQVVHDILKQGKDYGRQSIGANKKVHIEVVSANPTGPLHVGHGRLAAYSASLANVLDAGGYQVHREYYVNDAGRQMRILATSIWLRYLELCGEKFDFPQNAYKGDYIITIAKELKTQYDRRFLRSATEVFKGLPEFNDETKEIYLDNLVSRCQELLGKDDFKIVFDKGLNDILDDIRNDLEQFGVHCQEWFLESSLENGDVQRGIELLKKHNYLYEKEGAVWFKSTDFGDEKDRVVIRENGQATYFASDIGYHLNKFERGFDQLFDVYGADHHGYVPRIKAFLKALGKDVSKVHVLLVQFAILYRGETRVSMSTRGGEFVTLRELRDEVGNDAARFFYTMRKREQHLDFDLELAKSRTNENPVYYIQYAHARICSVFHQLALKDLTWQNKESCQHLHLLTEPQEKELLRNLARYPEVIEAAVLNYEPAFIAYYLQELANAFHSYYNAHVFLVEDTQLRDARLCLISATKQVLVNGLEILGISAPQTM